MLRQLGRNMNSSLDLMSIAITDLVGIALLVIILVARGWILPARKKESQILFALISVSIINCAVDLIVSFCDGKAEPVYRNISFIGNTYLYLYYLLVGIGIIFLTVRHIDKTIPRFQSIFFGLLVSIEVILLIANFFTPVVFWLDADNIYHRGVYYIVFIVGGFMLILYGYAFYFIAKIKTPSLRYFPVWQFLFPILLGLVIQVKIYGISLQPISFAIAFTGLVICLQNECIYIDKLTGVYNRYELDKVAKSAGRRRKERIAALMLDMNDFKSINDNYSHEEGDRALVAFADILVRIVRSEGIVIRFAGDEFVIIIRKFKGNDVESKKQKILDALEEYNKVSGKPYKLSAAVGGAVFECSDDNMSDLVAKIDDLMYKDKEKYYMEQDRKR